MYAYRDSRVFNADFLLLFFLSSFSSPQIHWTCFFIFEMRIDLLYGILDHYSRFNEMKYEKERLKNQFVEGFCAMITHVL